MIKFRVTWTDATMYGECTPQDILDEYTSENVTAYITNDDGDWVDLELSHNFEAENVRAAQLYVGKLLDGREVCFTVTVDGVSIFTEEDALTEELQNAN